MQYIDIFAGFLKMFPNYQETVNAYVPSGLNSIDIIMHDGQSINFTYFNNDDWRIIPNGRVD